MASRSRPFPHLTQERAATQRTWGRHSRLKTLRLGEQRATRMGTQPCVATHWSAAYSQGVVQLTAFKQRVDGGGQHGPRNIFEPLLLATWTTPASASGAAGVNLCCYGWDQRGHQHVTDLQVRPLDFHCRCSKEVNHSPTTSCTIP